MRKPLSLIAGAAVLGLALAGCSTGGGESDPGNADQVEVFTWWASGSEKVGLDALVKVFNEQYPDIEFINASVAGGAGSNAKAALASRLEANDPPDTFQAHAGAELTDYINAGQLQDLSSFYEEQGLTDVFPASLIEQLTVDGAIYSVPSNIHRANVTWVNTAVLEGAGIDPTKAPADIDAWIDDLQKLKDSGVESPLALGTEWTQMQLLENVLIADLGAEGYSGLWTGDTAWDSDGVKTAVDHYGELMKFVNSDFAGLEWDAATQILLDGNAGYNVMGDWAEAAFVQAGQTYGDEYTTWPTPGTDGVFDFLADSFTLPVGAPHEQAAKDWLTTISSAEGQKAFNIAKGSIPARTDATASDYPAYQQTAITSFADDTVVSSLAHGAAASISWSGDISSAVGKFGTDKDAASLVSALVAAADKALG
ncbi:carbohydrate ABC transporter substrate-binding protein (CUT1 family) [Homoserinimonas aerilata]|uniref:Probable sugar-binding periplasmic protein n=1 Tax=Homoserinimonas aerilata TaxID=1162970 RepID=A0A542YL28_9MICO|nr:ABC transporter substrate-binding protein [Homoserinimonas aerilata]TQL48800.1 carbohydrate ABC transporter substrate-binding protein (CUT1 family) [Homoserinimonas aerilata]